MFAMECASTLRECDCNSFDGETINNEFNIIMVGKGQIVLPYGMPDKQYQREARYIYIHIYITHQICNTCMTSKVMGMLRPTQHSVIT